MHQAVEEKMRGLQHFHTRRGTHRPEDEQLSGKVSARDGTLGRFVRFARHKMFHNAKVIYPVITGIPER